MGSLATHMTQILCMECTLIQLDKAIGYIISWYSLTLTGSSVGSHDRPINIANEVHKLLNNMSAERHHELIFSEYNVQK